MVNMQKLVVALESLGYQCQWLDGTLLANNGSVQALSFVEDAHGGAVGHFPAAVKSALQQVTEAQVNQRFSRQTLMEMGYGDFKPSSAKPTGVDHVTAQSLDIQTGDQAVTDEQPQRGPKTPQNASDLPGDFTGDSDNNDPADVPSTGGDSEATKVGPHGASKTGKPGPNNQKPEKTQRMSVGHSLQQMDAPNADKGDYEGSQVGEIKPSDSGNGTAKGVRGKAPAELPSTQGAQAEPKLPSPGKGKMTVTSEAFDRALASLSEADPAEIVSNEEQQNAQLAAENEGRAVFVVSRPGPGEPWTVAGDYEQASTEAIADAKEAAMEFTQANPDGGSMIIFSDRQSDEVRQALADGQNPQELGEVGISQGQTEALGGVARAIGAGAKVAGKAAGKLGAKAAKAGMRAAKAVGRKAGEVARDTAKAVGRDVAGSAKYYGGLARDTVSDLASGDFGGAVDRVGRATGQEIKGAGRIAKNTAKAMASAPGEVVRGVGRLAKDAVSADSPGDGSEVEMETYDALRMLRAGFRRVDEGVKEQVVEELVKGAAGILNEDAYGTVLHPETYTPLNVRETTEKITPVLVRMILEQDDEEDDPFPPPPEGDDEGTMDDEPADDTDLGADAGMPPGDDLGDPEDEAGMGPEMPGGEAPGEEDPMDMGDEGPMDLGGEDPGAPIDIGAAPEPQPVGDDPGAPGPEMGAPAPELPSDESRWAKAREQCPDCDDKALEKLVQVGIIGDLYNELVKNVTAQALQTQQNMTAEQPLVASQQAQDAPKLTERSPANISTFDVSRAWDEDPTLFVDSLVDGLAQDPSKVERAASMILGLCTEDYREKDIQEAREILQGLEEQIRQVRDSLQDVRLGSLGKVQALMGKRLARGAFAAEAQQMMDHLIKLEEGLESFMHALGRHIEEFDQRYGELIQTDELGGETDAEVPGEEPEIGGAEGADEPPPPPPSAPEAAMA